MSDKAARRMGSTTGHQTPMKLPATWADETVNCTFIVQATKGGVGSDNKTRG